MEIRCFKRTLFGRTSPLEDIIKVKQLAFSKIRRHPRNIILYHLDSLNIAQYSEENIRLIYK